MAVVALSLPTRFLGQPLVQIYSVVTSCYFQIVSAQNLEVCLLC